MYNPSHTNIEWESVQRDIMRTANKLAAEGHAKALQALGSAITDKLAHANGNYRKALAEAIQGDEVVVSAFREVTDNTMNKVTAVGRRKFIVGGLTAAATGLGIGYKTFQPDSQQIQKAVETLKTLPRDTQKIAADINERQPEKANDYTRAADMIDKIGELETEKGYLLPDEAYSILKHQSNLLREAAAAKGQIEANKLKNGIAFTIGTAIFAIGLAVAGANYIDDSDERKAVAQGLIYNMDKALNSNRLQGV